MIFYGTRGKGFLPNQISKATNSEVTHTATQVGSLVINAGAKCIFPFGYALEVYSEHVDNFKKRSNIICEARIDLTLEEEFKMLDYAAKYIGTAYDIKGLFGFGYKAYMMKLFNVEVNNVFAKGDKSLFCSEDSCLNYNYLCKLLNITPVQVKPHNVSPIGFFKQVISKTKGLVGHSKFEFKKYVESF